MHGLNKLMRLREIIMTTEHYLTEHEKMATTLVGHNIPWLNDLRNQALASFSDLGFPSTRHEAWKYTDTTAIQKQGFKTALKNSRENISIPFHNSLVIKSDTSPLFVFINGHFSPELSHHHGLPTQVIMKSLHSAIEEKTLNLANHLGRYKDQHADGFSALNLAFMQDGIYLELPPNTILDHPIQLLFIVTNPEKIAIYPRNLVLIGENSQVTICESYLSTDKSQYFTNAVTEIVIEKNAIVEHLHLQQESQQAFHISNLHVQQHENSQFTSHVYSFGGMLSRHEIKAQLSAEHAQCTLNGFYFANDRQHTDHHTQIDHLKPNTISNECYKGILNEHARGVFHGKIVVHPQAQKTNARQANNNLLLSENAEINTKPQLEIHADDVKCAHGATAGQLDEQALFYFQSRGIDRETARSLLLYAFANDLIKRVKSKPLQTRLQNILLRQLPAGHDIKEIL